MWNVSKYTKLQGERECHCSEVMLTGVHESILDLNHLYLDLPNLINCCLYQDIPYQNFTKILSNPICITLLSLQELIKYSCPNLHSSIHGSKI